MVSSHILSLLDCPSSTWDPRRLDPTDVSPQPGCIKGRSWPIHQPKACEDHERHGSISQRGTGIILHHSHRVPIGSLEQNESSESLTLRLQQSAQPPSQEPYSMASCVGKMSSETAQDWTGRSFEGCKLLEYLQLRLAYWLIMD
ncbi:hypothetical protein CK203_025656 [Vitis vinifera]|uniref:Uncharacterized protein n=1 Tax=Vitis vinifera TaxID=29760 RepID=A0A438IFF4_VITVI|nr:hypothetical protein CK203_025656 [Vitis vinifera]